MAVLIVAVAEASISAETADGARNLVSNPVFHTGVFSPEKWSLNQSAGNRVH